MKQVYYVFLANYYVFFEQDAAKDVVTCFNKLQCKELFTIDIDKGQVQSIQNINIKTIDLIRKEGLINNQQILYVNRDIFMINKVIFYYLNLLYQYILKQTYMDLEEFKFVYHDLKHQLKEIPSLPLLLKSIEKTTKKLDCLNLYSQVDRKDFDFQLFQKDIFAELTLLLSQVQILRSKAGEQSLKMSEIVDLQHKFERIKQQKIEAFDRLNKMQQSLQQQLQKLIDEQSFNNPLKLQNEIKQVQEDEQQNQEQELDPSNHNENKIQKLKRQIEDLNKKISAINKGKGKWFDGDHNDFLKIYTKYNGDTKKVLDQGCKVLGMKNTQIMDHIEVYQTYLQFQKQKKLVNEEFKSIKEMQKQMKYEKQMQSKAAREERQRLNKKLKDQENLNKKLMIEEYKRKKNEQKQKLLKQIQNEKEMSKKVVKVSLQKKKSIEERNKKLIQQRQQMLKAKNNVSQQKKNEKNKAKANEPLLIKPKIKVPLPKPPENKV